ncbi:sodium/proline symporter PutP [Cellulomonas triticagri]|uniref:Sodium/proline symporter n=1 Tax=Cellulomonas triticagri TaxID=2483352 RepID=A0A3M2JJT6_9CELL|nr:sodium/proline symporter PutP [Cellulomonas triticagri]RMI14337.1 sodium/proline symporter PutP [Cellulomonas triticagri]
MSERTYQLTAVAVYFAVMVAIGVYASRRNRSHEDYLLAGRRLRPWTAALSAGASDMSGWLMMGLPGAIFLAGLVEAWIAIGLTIGAYLNWRLVAPRLRAYTEVSGDAITIPSFLENRFRDTSHALRLTSGLVILVFFTFYISAGMVAGGVFFQASFGSSYLTGMLLVAAVTLAYTLVGGFLGASLTDVVQGLMMMTALLVVPALAVAELGGPAATLEALRDGLPDGLALVPAGAAAGATALAVVSALAWGLGYFGQPHIIVRFMAMQAPSSARSARRIGMTWMVLSLLGAVACGLVGAAYVHSTGIDLADPETVVLHLSQVLMHPLVSGLVLAAVLAAIMSTISSQLVVCSSALVEDLYRAVSRTPPAPRRLLLLGRAGVLVIALIAALLAVTPNGSILGLVGFAWAGFGASFGPVVLLSLFWRRLTTAGSLAALAGGSVTVIVWSLLDTGLYELLPGFVVATLLAVVVSRRTHRPDAQVDQEFATAAALSRSPGARNVPGPTQAG